MYNNKKYIFGRKNPIFKNNYNFHESETNVSKTQFEIFNNNNCFFIKDIGNYDIMIFIGNNKFELQKGIIF